MGRLRRRPDGIEAGPSDGVLAAQQLLSELQIANTHHDEDDISYNTRPRPRSSPLPSSKARYQQPFVTDALADESPPLFAVPPTPALFQVPDSCSVASDNISSDEIGVTPPLGSSSSIESPRSRTFFGIFTSLVERYMIPPYKLLTYACFAFCIVQFAPILLPAAVMLMIYWLLDRIISSTRSSLLPSLRAILQLTAMGLLVMGAVTLMGYFKDGQPPSWTHIRKQWGDDFLLMFEDKIDEGCGQMGRRLMELHSDRDGLHPSSPRCVPHLCPATLSFLDHPNPYLVLGFDFPPHTQPLTKEVISKAYHSLVLTYHPDKVHQHHLPPDKSAFILRAIHSAGKILLNDEARAEWDRQWLSPKNKAARFGQLVNRARRGIATNDIEGWDFWADIAGSDVDGIRHHWGRKERVGQGGWWEMIGLGAWWMLWWWDRAKRGLEWVWRVCSGNWT
ncbi:MAG: hypothetical protein LQ343_006818 [Gyalolechia ehrenbergii]|nr:MAG: hypothetical protein LQ343_006818 [Gyalolechia ehrenbergii]